MKKLRDLSFAKPLSNSESKEIKGGFDNCRISTVFSVGNGNSLAYIATVLIVLMSVVGFMGCNSTESNREHFLENLEKNIDVCAAPIIAKGVDTLTARSKCLCMLEFLYKKDSTFLQMSESEVNKFVNSLGEELLEHCPPLHKDSIQ